MPVETLISIDDIQQFQTRIKDSGKTLAFVPTMGALHKGHATLFDVARRHADSVISSIFVNPLQFGPNEDFAKYPRTLNADLELAEDHHVDAVFIPNIQDIYPSISQTRVYNDRLANELCGAFRPGHFDGVLTVVMKLFGIVKPDFVVFGKKDYQQLKLISLMIEDFHLPMQMIGVETVRESDGLAMSSRNRYLNDEQRHHAATISAALFTAVKMFGEGERNPSNIENAAAQALSKELVVEYLSIRSQRDLSIFSEIINEPAVMLLAAKIGTTRLIDNMELNPKE